MSRVLVVEDEQHLAEGLRFNLEAEGYQVQLVDAGEAALEKLRTESQAFDVVILDVMLPGISGFDVVSRMRESGQFVPTLMLTARGHADDVLKGFAAGADDYLTKPFELSILIARIRGLAQASRNGCAPRRYPKLNHRPSRPRIEARIHFRRKIGGFRSAGAARARSSLPAHFDGGERPSLPDRKRRQACFAQNRCSPTSGACMKTPTPAPSITSSCACAAISKTTPPVRAIYKPCGG